MHERTHRAPPPTLAWTPDIPGPDVLRAPGSSVGSRPPTVRMCWPRRPSCVKCERFPLHGCAEVAHANAGSKASTRRRARMIGVPAIQ
eukprot:6111540-Prymnesium_polylepis.1